MTEARLKPDLAHELPADTVDIVLATYNGARFLAEQIASIRAQSHEDWRLLVCDDGSSDNTCAIVQAESATDARIVLCASDRVGGAARNFLRGLTFTSARYIAFADQDDIWDPDKLETTLAALQRLRSDSGGPGLIFTNLRVAGPDGRVIDDDFYRYKGYDPRLNLDMSALMWRSSVYGCTALFDRALLERITIRPALTQMHDQFLALNALENGQMHYLDRATLNYRQHGGNVVGTRRRRLSLRRVQEILRYRAGVARKLWQLLCDRPARGALESVGLAARLGFAARMLRDCAAGERLYAWSIMILFILGPVVWRRSEPAAHATGSGARKDRPE